VFTRHARRMQEKSTSTAAPSSYFRTRPRPFEDSSWEMSANPIGHPSQQTKGILYMWFQIGSWIGLGVHFGSPDKSGGVQSRYLFHATIRWGQVEWYHGPARLPKTGDRDATFGSSPPRRVYFRSKLEPVTQPHLWR
jgi:hypothetical protein